MGLETLEEKIKWIHAIPRISSDHQDNILKAKKMERLCVEYTGMSRFWVLGVDAFHRKEIGYP